MNEKFDFSDAKICVDCKFARVETDRPFLGMKGWMPRAVYGDEQVVFVGCTRVKLSQIDIVTGQDFKTSAILDANKARADNDLCGYMGQWFEPKVDDTEKDV